MPSRSDACFGLEKPLFLKGNIMKRILGTCLFTLATATPALARGGDDAVLTRGSQAWFAVETAEHELRALLAAGAIDAAAPTGLSVDLTSTSASEIVIDTATTQLTDACQMVDHWSRRGTVLKKEVYCDVLPGQEPRFTIARGTNASRLIEGVEHALRAAVVANPAVKEAVSFVEADLVGGRVVGKIGLTDGSEIGF